MSLSEERLSHLAHLVIDGIWNDDLVDYTDEDNAMRVGKQMVMQWAKEEASLDAAVRAKIASLKRTVLEGTTEWEVMFAKYYEEELKKRGT